MVSKYSNSCDRFFSVFSCIYRFAYRFVTRYLNGNEKENLTEPLLYLVCTNFLNDVLVYVGKLVYKNYIKHF